MPTLPIDLGEDMNSVLKGPATMSSKKLYPTLHLNWPSDYDLPESGEMTITFKKSSETKEKRNGKTRYSVSLEIKTIEDVESDEEEAAEDAEESGSDALDRHAKEVVAAKDNEDY